MPTVRVTIIPRARDADRARSFQRTCHVRNVTGRENCQNNAQHQRQISCGRVGHCSNSPMALDANLVNAVVLGQGCVGTETTCLTSSRRNKFQHRCTSCFANLCHAQGTRGPGCARLATEEVNLVKLGSSGSLSLRTTSRCANNILRICLRCSQGFGARRDDNDAGWRVVLTRHLGTLHGFTGI